VNGVSPDPALPLDEARLLRMGERDAGLQLHDPHWPAPRAALRNWASDPDNGFFHRVVGMERLEERTGGRKGPRGELALEERLLRFPSAPIHGLHRLSQEHVNMGPVESFHTCRLLSHPNKRGPVTRIFLMHNGLNETQRIGLYYELASYLIEQDPGTVCILRPFPGHLTRCAYPGLSETPLDHYLWDGLHLFRQFLRYLIETRWLLSTIARYSYYHCVSGSGLLGEKRHLADSRLQEEVLAKAMAQEWENLHGASDTAIGNQGDGSPLMPPAPPSITAFTQAIVSMRDALRLDSYPPKDGSSPITRKAEPDLHVIGYSLGGFTAQSVFMSWPFLVSSCSTLLSGGAMRELAPTAFADPEEWQTVLHSLRYELDDAMMDWRFAAADNGLVAGMEPGLFRYLKRTFYEVFEQEYRGSFQTRLVAFRQRMLFVVGGNDPIVRPQSVLDSSPPDGINMVAVGAMGHFLEGGAQGQVEKEQREFWLPEIGRTIGRLARHAAAKHRSDLRRTWLDEDDLVPDRKAKRPKNPEKWRDLKRLSVAERLEVQRDGTLPSPLFQRSLDDLLSRAADKENDEGFLFVLKNEPPTFLLGTRALQQHAAAMYHEDVSIVDYVREVRLRQEVITEEAYDRLCVVLPWNLETILTNIDARLQHPSQSESSGEPMGFPEDARTTWEQLSQNCVDWTTEKKHDWIRVFDGRKTEDRQINANIEARYRRDLDAAACTYLKVQDEMDQVVPALPDCWVWMSMEFLRIHAERVQSLDSSIASLCEIVPDYLGRDKQHIVAERLRSDDLRILTMSRSRYNPRFRGRIVAEPRQAQELLLRFALCVVASVPFRDFSF
jgi:pimeloyl-ACP methyl ester carboxylesterase